MINSMTAFARSEIASETFSVCVEIRSYNSRHLDLVVRLTRGYEELEEKIKRMASDRLTRGRVEIKIQIKNQSGDAIRYDVDEPGARAFYDALVQLKEMFELKEEISLKLLTGARDILKPVEVEKDVEGVWPMVEESLGKALEELSSMRGREGAFIADDLAMRLRLLEEYLEKIALVTEDMPALYRERLSRRIMALTDGLVEVEPGRIAQEAAFLADKSDISEEIVRVRSHVEQFRAIMDGPEPGGRKLNFLLQEFLREFNTIGSKTEKTEAAHAVVEAKSELEKIREQVQNIE
ncbi:MAG: YicC family protein [Desulfobacterales bacterium]|nr:YicC family protein [Desulfobacterales bacterium]